LGSVASLRVGLELAGDSGRRVGVGGCGRLVVFLDAQWTRKDPPAELARTVGRALPTMPEGTDAHGRD